MVKPRVQINGPQALPANSPTASPVSQFAGAAPYTPKQFLTDFSGLSQTLGRIAEINKGDRAKQSEADALVALSDPDFSRAVTEGPAAPKPGIMADPGALKEVERQGDIAKQFNRLVQSGKIKETQSPIFWETVYKASAQQVVSQYRRDVFARMDEATNSVHPSKSIEQIQQEEWEKYANHPSIKNYFGAMQAGEVLPGVNSEIADYAARKYQETAQIETRRTLTQLALDKLDSFAGQKVWDQGQHEQLQSMVDSWHKGNIADSRGLFMDVLTNAVTKLSVTSAVDAKDLLENAMQVKIAGVALENDAQVGKEINALLMRVNKEVEDEEKGRLQRTENNVRTAERMAESVALSQLQFLSDNNLNVASGIPAVVAEVERRLVEEGLSEYLPQARRYAEELMSKEFQNGDLTLFETASDLLESGNLTFDALKSFMPRLNAAQYANLSERLKAREAATETLRQADWGRITGALARNRESFGLQEGKHGAFFEDLTMELEDAFVAKAQELENDPQGPKILRQWATDQVKEARAKIEAYEAKARQDEDAFRDQMMTSIHSRVDNTAQILQARAMNIISPEEAEPLLARATEASSWQWMENEPLVAEGLRSIGDMVESSEAGTALENVNVAAVRLKIENARSFYRKTFRTKFDELRSQGEGFKTKAQADAAVEAAHRESMTTMAKAFNIPQELIDAEPGQVKEVAEVVQQYMGSVDGYKQERQALTLDRENLYTTGLLPQRVQQAKFMTSDFRDAVVQYQSGNSSWNPFRLVNGVRVGLGTVDRDSLYSILEGELDNIIGTNKLVRSEEGVTSPAKDSKFSGANPDALNEALMAYSLVGIQPEDLLKGYITYIPQVLERNESATADSARGRLVRENVFGTPRYVSYNSYRDITNPIQIPINPKGTLGLQTRINFGSVGEMLSFFETHSDKVPEMVKALGIPLESLNEFVAAQRTYLETRPR